MIPELGKRLSVPQAAALAQIGAETVRKNYTLLGGFLLGRRIYFYEEVLKDANLMISNW